MFFISQIDELIGDERKAYRSYVTWLALILGVGLVFILVSVLQHWFSDLGPTLSSAFLLLLSKPPFTEMMKHKEKIKTLTSLRKMSLLVKPGSKEADEIEKLVVKTFRDMLKA